MENPLQDIFIQEAEDNLRVLESLIISLEETPDDSSGINDAFRAIHSIKGGAGLAGFNDIKEYTHKLEDLFELIRNGNLKIGKDLISVILRGMDILNNMIANIRDDKDSLENINNSESLREIEKYLNAETSEDQETDHSKQSSEKKAVFKNLFYMKLEFNPEVFNTGIDPLMFIEDLEKDGTILFRYTDCSSLPEITAFDPEKLYLSWELFYQSEKTIQQISDIFCFVIDESNIVITLLDKEGRDTTGGEIPLIKEKSILNYTDALPEKRKDDRRQNDRRSKDRRQGSRRDRDGSLESYIRVPTSKLEKIFNTVSELLISQARLNLLTEENEDQLAEDFIPVSDSLKNLSGLLQEQITSLRMISLGNTFDSFRRIVRDIAGDRGKEVKMQIEGKETELDKNMIEKLNDPLKHLIRNCIDHGIESKEERLALGKSPEGIIKLAAYVEGGKVVIEISDDGKGIDRKKLLQKAMDKGIIPAEKKLSDGEILNLIFHPGLSTAEKVTDLSGRGVGMDVVKSNITELHGNIEINSIENDGTSFKLNLPLTLAILDGMLVSLGADKYIIPTLSILEIFRPRRDALKTIYGGDSVVLFRDEYIPVVRLYEIFNVDNAEPDPVKAELIVVSSGGIKAAVLVDNVLEQYQVVLKSMQKNFRKIRNISSATILGDGTVALIVDMSDLIHNQMKVKNVQSI